MSDEPVPNGVKTDASLTNSGLDVHRSGMNSCGRAKARSSASLSAEIRESVTYLCLTSMQGVSRDLHDSIPRYVRFLQLQTLRWRHPLHTGRNGGVKTQRLVNASIEIRELRQGGRGRFLGLSKVLVELLAKLLKDIWVLRKLKEETGQACRSRVAAQDAVRYIRPDSQGPEEPHSPSGYDD